MEHFEAMVHKHYSSVYHFLLKLCDYRSDIAEDLAQDVFLQAYLSISTFHGNCLLKTWLIQIAKNRFYMYLRKNKRQAASFEELIAEPSDKASERIENKFCKRELLANARLIIDAMQPKMRDVMLYRIYSDLPYAQISCLLSISESSAKVLFHRGKTMLRQKLKEEFGYEI